MTYRRFNVNFWTDPVIEQQRDPLQKLLTIYLEKNRHLLPSGIYFITPYRISGETGIPEAKVVELLPTLSPRILYDPDIDLVFARNFLKDNFQSKSFLTCVINSLKDIPDHPFLREFIEEYRTLMTVCGQCVDTLIPLSVTDTDSVSVKDRGVGKGEGVVSPAKTTEPVKEKHFDFVWLTADEYRKLIEQLGGNESSRLILDLNYYAHKLGEEKFNKKYESHYLTILSWHRKGKNGQTKPSESKRSTIGAEKKSKTGTGKYSKVGKELPSGG